MSKMTVSNETTDLKSYNVIQMSEFCEMIARVAEKKFQKSEMSDISLSEKIGYVIDQISEPFGLQKKHKNDTIIDESASDSDC